MKKRLLLMLLALIVMFSVACSDNSDATEDVDPVDELNEDTENDGKEADADVDEEDGEAETSSNAEKDQEDKDSSPTLSEKDPEKDEPNSEDKNGWKKPTEIENMDHLPIVHLAYDIFEAQDKKDYAFLKSIAAKGTTVDEKNNTFIFENVTYPFEIGFFTKQYLGKVEFRYTHEQDDGTVIVGFGSTENQAETHIVIDFEFVNENGTWKMKSMDVNK